MTKEQARKSTEAVEVQKVEEKEPEKPREKKFGELMMDEEEKVENAYSESIDYSSESEAREAIASVDRVIALEQNAVSDKSRGLLLDNTALDYSQEESKLGEIKEELDAGFEGFRDIKHQIIAREQVLRDIEDPFTLRPPICWEQIEAE